jgi:hypothetical protein
VNKGSPDSRGIAATFHVQPNVQATLAAVLDIPFHLTSEIFRAHLALLVLKSELRHHKIGTSERKSKVSMGEIFNLE